MSNSNHIQGTKLFDEGDYNKALTAFKKALEKTENDVQLWYETGLCYFHLKQTGQALKALDKAVELEPENGFRYSSRAFVKGSIKDSKGAAEDYQKALDLDPEDAVSYNNLGLVLEELGRKKQAEEKFAKADELAKNQELFPDQKVDGRSLNANAQKEAINIALPTDKKETYFSVLTGVFTNKNAFKEFILFVKNGFSVKK